MNKFCANCGNELRENSKFCLICGTSVGQAEPPKAANGVQAQPAYGGQQPAYGVQQPAPLPPNAPMQQGVPPQTVKKKRTGLKVFFIILASILVLVGAFFIMKATGTGIFKGPLPSKLKKVPEGTQKIEWGGISLAAPEDFQSYNFGKKNIILGDYYPRDYGVIVLTYDDYVSTNKAMQELEVIDTRMKFKSVYEESEEKGLAYRVYKISGVMEETDEREIQGSMEAQGIEPEDCFVSYYIIFPRPGIKEWAMNKLGYSAGGTMYTAVFKGDFNSLDIIDLDETLSFNPGSDAPQKDADETEEGSGEKSNE